MGNWEVWVSFPNYRWFCGSGRCITVAKAKKIAKLHIRFGKDPSIIIKHRRTGREVWAWHREEA